MQEPAKNISTERELLERIARGDQQAFQQLFEAYWDKVYSVALTLSKSAELAEDIAQDIFTDLWAKRGTLEKIGALESYLFITARNRILSRMRREVLSDKYRQYLKLYFEEGAETGHSVTEFREARQLLHRGISLLPPQQQKAFRLSRIEGLNHDEIAEEMRISRTAIKSYIVRSIAFLRKFMEQHAIHLFIFF